MNDEEIDMADDDTQNGDTQTGGAADADASNVTLASNTGTIQPAGVHTQGGGGTAMASTQDVADV